MSEDHFTNCFIEPQYKFLILIIVLIFLFEIGDKT